MTPTCLDDLVARLVARFGPQILSASALARGPREALDRQLERLRALRPRTIVEIGTRFGVTAAALGGIAERVVTIDLHASPRVPEVLACAGVANVAAVRVADDAAKALLLDGLDFDLAFIDGDHDREAVALDFAHTRRCGTVLFHDYADPGFHGVTDFVDGLAVGTVLRDAPFAWWLAASGSSWRHGTPLCAGPGLLCR